MKLKETESGPQNYWDFLCNIISGYDHNSWRCERQTFMIAFLNVDEAQDKLKTYDWGNFLPDNLKFRLKKQI